jgi:hypothetical protein
VRTACGINLLAPPHSILSIHATRLLGLHSLAFEDCRTKEKFVKHRVGTTGHTHRISFVPAPIFHWFAMTLPWRRSLVPIPQQAIHEAEERNDLCDQLFVMWATERNARCLAKELRQLSAGTHDKARAMRKPLRERIKALRTARLALQQVLIDSINIRSRNDSRRHR